VASAAFGLAASLITFRELWAAAGVGPSPPPPEEGSRQEEKEVGANVQEIEPSGVEPDPGVSGSASSYVEVEAVQA
jgi:hypothetical protein